MKVFFDTSVLVAALIDSHPNYSRAFPWLLKAKQGEIEGFICVHTIAELYSVLTSIPTQKKIPADEIWSLINKSIILNFKVIELTREDYKIIINSIAENEIRGGATYDAIIAHAAYKANAEKLLTFNLSHFKRVYPAISGIVQTPS